MIHRMSVGNFYCIRDTLDLNLSVSGQAPEDHEKFALVAGSVRIPKVVGLIGANASGKSTILRVLSFVSWYIQHGFRLPPNAPIPCYRFNSKSHLNKPITIELEFDAPVDLSDKGARAERCRYVYGLRLNGGKGSQPTFIEEEHLACWPPQAARRVRIFERDKDGLTFGARAFQLTGYTRAIPRVLRPNVSLISTLAQLAHEPSVVLRDIASKIESNIFIELHSWPIGYTAETYLNDKRLFDDLNREISKLDLGIEKVVIAKPEGDKNYPDATFLHHGLAGPLPIDSESEGTRQFFRIFPMLSQALHFGGIAVVDEFDTSIHPLILPELLRWFYDSKRNSKGAQLWFTAQNPYLLSVLEKEQILLCQKDELGGASTFRLADIKAVRRMDNFMRKYLGGEFGAVPHLG
jgi:hypothetical protein